MTGPLRDALGDRGARFDPDLDLVLDFGDPASELDALHDASAWTPEPVSAILATGPDLPDLLNRLSTRQVHDLAPGDGRATVVTSPKGRIVRRLWCHHLDREGVLLLDGLADGAGVVAHLGRYTFAERTGLQDAGDTWRAIAVRGPRAADALRSCGLPTPESSRTAGGAVAGAAVRVLGHDLLSPGSGWTVLFDDGDAAAVVAGIDDAIRGTGGRACGRDARETWRISRGLAADGLELTEDHNPLEAGLRFAVDFDKGCYVGQEVVARLETYDKVSRRLAVVAPGDDPGAIPERGAAIASDGRTIGALTSVAGVPGGSGWIALGYVKRSRFAAGAEVTLGESGTPARLHDPPVDVRDLAPGNV